MADYGSLPVQITGDTKQLETTLKKLDKTATKALGGMALAQKAFYTAIGVTINKVAQLGDRIDKQSQKIGISTDAYQKWNFVLSQNGASIDNLQGSMRFLNRAIDSNEKAFKQLGITQQELQQLQPEQIFERTIEALQRMDAGVERNTIAARLLGRGYQELAPLLNQTADATNELKKSFEDSGMTLDQKAIKASVEYADALDKLKKQSEITLARLTTELMPELTKTIENLSSYLATNKEQIKAWGKSIASTMQNIGSALGTLFDMFNALPDDIKGAAGIGIIGAILLGGKKGVILGSVVHLLGVITNTIAGLIAVSEGKISLFDFATANKKELEDLLAGLEEVQEVTESIYKETDTPKKIGFELDEKSAEALKAIKEQIKGLSDTSSYTDQLQAGLDAIAEKAKDTALNVKELQGEFERTFTIKKADEASQYIRSFQLEIANMVGNFKEVEQIELANKFDEIESSLRTLMPDMEATDQIIADFQETYRKAYETTKEKSLLEQQISGLTQFTDLMPEINKDIEELQLKLAKIKINEIRILFEGDEEALAKIDKIEERLERMNDKTFQGGINKAIQTFVDEWDNAAKLGEKAMTSVLDAVSNAFSSVFDTIFDGAEFRADQLLKNLGKQLLMLSFQAGIGKLFGGILTFHDGGEVGTGDGYISPMSLNNNEVFAKLEKGEIVLNKQEARDYKNGVGAKVIVYNTTQVKDTAIQTTQRTTADGITEIRNLIISTVSENFAQGGEVALAQDFYNSNRGFAR